MSILTAVAQAGPDPPEFGWWLASRAAGIVALALHHPLGRVGLAMAGRVSRRPALAARCSRCIARGARRPRRDRGARHHAARRPLPLPSIADIAIPFASEHEPLWTGLGVTGGWMAAILGLSYWIRTRLPAGLWRRLHRVTVLVYVLSVAHTLGAGTDASEPWMRVLLLVTGAPILFLFLARILTPPGARAGVPSLPRGRPPAGERQVLSFDAGARRRRTGPALRAGPVRHGPGRRSRGADGVCAATRSPGAPRPRATASASSASPAAGSASTCTTRSRSGTSSS